MRGDDGRHVPQQPTTIHTLYEQRKLRPVCGRSDPDVRAVVCHAGESSSCPHARLGGMIARTAVGRGDRWEGGMLGMLAIHYTAAIIVALVILLALAGYAIWYLFVKMGK